MKRALSASMAATLPARHEAEGVEFIFGAAVTEIVGEGAMRKVILSTGAQLAAEVVLIGIGAEAASGLAAAAGVVVE